MVCYSGLSYVLLYYSGENTLHSLSATYKTLEQNEHTREAAHTHSPSWSLCELTPVPHGSPSVTPRAAHLCKIELTLQEVIQLRRLRVDRCKKLTKLRRLRVRWSSNSSKSLVARRCVPWFLLRYARLRGSGPAARSLQLLAWPPASHPSAERACTERVAITLCPGHNGRFLARAAAR